LVSAVSVCDASVDTIVELAIRFPVVVKCRRVTMPLNVYGLHFETIAQGTGTNFRYNEEAKRRRRKNGKQIGTAGPLFGTSKFDGLLAAKDEKNLKKKKLGESTAIYCA
jgi:hypothetical protein